MKKFLVGVIVFLTLITPFKADSKVSVYENLVLRAKNYEMNFYLGMKDTPWTAFGSEEEGILADEPLGEYSTEAVKTYCNTNSIQTASFYYSELLSSTVEFSYYYDSDNMRVIQCIRVTPAASKESLYGYAVWSHKGVSYVEMGL